MAFGIRSFKSSLSIFSRPFCTSMTFNKKGSKAQGVSSFEWIQRQRNDPYVRKAQIDGYRARSAYKLKEIIGLNKRFLAPGMAVLECGCSPGAWSQVASQAINADGQFSERLPPGMLIGIDLLHMETIEGVHFIQGDFNSDNVKAKALKILGSNRKFDVVLSDMAPNASGIRSLDEERLVNLVVEVLRFAVQHSYPGGGFLCKLWYGGNTKLVLDELRRFYHSAQVIKPDSSRDESAEIFIIAENFRGLKSDDT